MKPLHAFCLSLTLPLTLLYPEGTEEAGVETGDAVGPAHPHFYLFSPTRHRNLSYVDPEGNEVSLRLYSSSFSGPHSFDASADMVLRQGGREGEQTEIFRLKSESTGEAGSLVVILPAVLDPESPTGAILSLETEVDANGEVTLLNLTGQELEVVYQSERFSLAPFDPSEPKSIGRRGAGFRIEDSARQQTRIFIESAPQQRLLVTLSPPFAPGTRELQVHTLSLPRPPNGND